MNYELSDCIRRDDGTVVCWDCVLHKLVRLTIEPIPVSTLTEKELELLLRKRKERDD